MNKKPEENSFLMWKFFAISSFIMLSTMTWASKPFQKIFEKIQEKETVKAELKICSMVRQLQPKHTKHIEDIFASGCLYGTREAIYMMAEGDDGFNAVIKNMFNNQDSIEFGKYDYSCNYAKSKILKENSEEVISALYNEDLKCPEVFDKAEKLGISTDEQIDRKAK